MAKVSDAERSAGAESSLQLQAPSLVLRRVYAPSQGSDGWGKKVWNRRLNLGKGAAGSESIDEG